MQKIITSVLFLLGVPILLTEDDLDATAATAKQSALSESLRTRTGFPNSMQVPDPLGLQQLYPASVTHTVIRKIV
jgi:hypothetical protein